MIDLDFQKRFDLAETFLDNLVAPPKESYHLLARRALRDGDLPLGFCLLHPELLGHPITYQRRPRQFSSLIHRDFVACQAERFWGVPCMRREDLHADHDWPHSMGGPTLPGNLTWLCSVHNQCKGSDIHCWPWEMGVFPDWAFGELSAQASSERVR